MSVVPLKPNAIEARVANCDVCPFARLTSIGMTGFCGDERDQDWVCLATRSRETAARPLPSTSAERAAGSPTWCPLRIHGKITVRWTGDRPHRAGEGDAK